MSGWILGRLPALLVILAAATLSSAARADEPLTLERIMGSPALSGPVPRGLGLSPDGKLATLLEARVDDRDRYDLWALGTGPERAGLPMIRSRVRGSSDRAAEGSAAAARTTRRAGRESYFQSFIACSRPCRRQADWDADGDDGGGGI